MAAAEVTSKNCLEIVHKVDKNGNGKLDREEFAQWIEDWLGVKMRIEDVVGLWKMIHKSAAAQNEIHLHLVGKWLWALYDFSAKQSRTERDVLHQLQEDDEETRPSR